MFNRTTVIAPRQVEVREVTKTVVEKRAPTDESVRLLREMQGSAMAEVEQSIRVGDTTFDCVVHFMRMPIDDTVILKAVFSLNGKKMVAEYTEARWRYDKVTAFNGLVDAMAKKIAAEILVPAMTAAMRDTTFAMLGERTMSDKLQR